MGPEGAVNIVFRKARGGGRPEARRAELIADYKAQFANPYTAAGYVDDVIEPRRTRPVLCDALATALAKREAAAAKHGNIPLRPVDRGEAVRRRGRTRRDTTTEVLQ